LREITRKTENMSLKKKPNPLASTPPTGGVGVPKPLQELFSTQKQDWIQDLNRALEPKTPTHAIELDEGTSKKPKNKIVINSQTFSGGSMTSTLNTPVMSNTPELINTPDPGIMTESPIQTMLLPENQMGFEQITELTLPVVQYPDEDSIPISVPVDNTIFNMPETINSIWGTLDNSPFALDSNQCVAPRTAEGIDFTLEESMDQILCNNVPEICNTDTAVSFSPMDNFDAASLNTATAPQGDILDWLFNKTIGADEDAQVEAHYPPVDMDIAEEDDFLPSFIKDLDVQEIEPQSSVVHLNDEPTPSTSAASQLNQPCPIEFKVEVIKKKARGRPPKEGPRHITPKPEPVHKDRRTDTDHIYMGVVHDNKGDQRYRRMRDLNNDASKRCRQNRKQKFAILEMEKEQLLEKNSELKFKVKKMEEIVASLKKKFISDIANPVKVEVPTPAAPPAQVPSFVVTQPEDTFSFLVPQATTSAQAPVFTITSQAANNFPQEATNFPDLLDLEWSGIE